MSVDVRQSLNCLQFPSRYKSISRSQLSKQHTGDNTREAEKPNCDYSTVSRKRPHFNANSACPGTLRLVQKFINMEHMNSSNIATSIVVEQKRSPSVDTNLEEVRIIGISEYKEAAECLAQAFGTDAVARYFFDTPDMAKYSEEFKWKLHVDIMRYITAAHCYKGLVTTIGPNHDAVALWSVVSLTVPLTSSWTQTCIGCLQEKIWMTS